MSTSELITTIVGIVVGLICTGDLLATVAVKWKLDTIDKDLRQVIATQAQHATTIAVHHAEINRLATEFLISRAIREDMAGFLQTMGYKKRDFTSVVPIPEPMALQGEPTK